MCGTEGAGAFRRDDRGSTLALMLLLATAISAFCVFALTSSAAVYKTAKLGLETSKAFYVAEGGMDYALSQLTVDNYWAAHSPSDMPAVEADGSFESDWLPLGTGIGTFKVNVAYATANKLPSTWTSLGFPPGYQPYSIVTFNPRTQSPTFDRMIVKVTGRYEGVERSVRASLRFQVKEYNAAIIDDGQSVAGTGSGKSYAIDHRTIVFDGFKQAVWGGIRSNGAVDLDGSSTPLTSDNISTELNHFSGPMKPNLYGTSEEIPDLTTPGSTKQLFDFNRFQAAAAAGAGATYNSLAAFSSAMNAANAAGRPLEGIIYVTVDAAAEGGSPKLSDDKTGATAIPGGINVKGTLAFHFINPPDNFYKVFIETPLHINAANLPANFDPKNSKTFATGYPPAFSTPSKDPRNVNIAPAFANFEAEDDLPALIFDNGTVDIHHETNICGVVYGPSFIEIENKHQQRQYFDGCLIGGAGMYLEGGSNSVNASQTFVYDPSAIDLLATFNNEAKTPVIDAYTTGK